jgi:hypothetical protein
MSFGKYRPTTPFRKIPNSRAKAWTIRQNLFVLVVESVP